MPCTAKATDLCSADVKITPRKILKCVPEEDMNLLTPTRRLRNMQGFLLNPKATKTAQTRNMH